MCNFSMLKSNLEGKGYTVSVFENSSQAVEYLSGKISGKIVGFGGSKTLHEIGLFNALNSHNTVFWHDEKPEGLTVYETRKKATQAEVYISSVNGISLNGEIKWLKRENKALLILGSSTGSILTFSNALLMIRLGVWTKLSGFIFKSPFYQLNDFGGAKSL